MPPIYDVDALFHVLRRSQRVRRFVRPSAPRAGMGPSLGVTHDVTSRIMPTEMRDGMFLLSSNYAHFG
jgi:hypothetical protein